MSLTARDRLGLAGHRLHTRFLTHGRFAYLSLAAYPDRGSRQADNRGISLLGRTSVDVN